MEKKKKSAGIAITEGVIWKQILLFFFPILLGTFFQQLYNTADAMVVGRFVGKEALAAVGGPTGTLINLLVGFFVGLSSGATVIISQFYGGNNPEQVSRAVHTSMALAVIGGAVMMVMGIFGAEFALRAMGTPEDIMPYSVLYMRIYFVGIIANMIYNIGSGILRAIGDSKRPLYFLIVSCLLNIVLDLVLVVNFHMGVAGVGLGTIISQLVSAVLVLITLIRTRDSYRLIPRNIRIDKVILAKIIQIGLPAGLQSVMYSVSNIIIQASVNGLGTNTVAAWTAYGKIDGVFWMTINAFGVAITTFVGQNYGAGKMDRVKKGIRQCTWMGMAAALGLSVILYGGGNFIYQLFTTDPEVLSIGMDILHFLVPFFVTYVCIEILSGALRGTGDSLIPMIMTCLGVCVLRVLWIMILVPVWPGIRTILVSYPISWVITSFLFVLYYAFFSPTTGRRKKRARQR